MHLTIEGAQMPRYLNRTCKVPQGIPAVSYKEVSSEDRNKTPDPVQDLLPIELKSHEGKVIHNSDSKCSLSYLLCNYGAHGTGKTSCYGYLLGCRWKIQF